MIEKWKDTAFGSDFGGDFLELIESLTDKELSIELIYQNTDLKKYIDKPNLLEVRTDNNVFFVNTKFEQYVHFEDAIIALSAIIVESEVNGVADLSKAYGNKQLFFKSYKSDIVPIFKALKNIFDQPEKYVLFEMCLEEERKETLSDIQSILTEFERVLKLKKI